VVRAWRHTIVATSAATIAAVATTGRGAKVAAILVLAATFVSRPVVATAVIVALLVATMVWRHSRAALRTA
jgi:hypothetical protein